VLMNVSINYQSTYATQPFLSLHWPNYVSNTVLVCFHANVKPEFSSYVGSLIIYHRQILLWLVQ